MTNLLFTQTPVAGLSVRGFFVVNQNEFVRLTSGRQQYPKKMSHQNVRDGIRATYKSMAQFFHVELPPATQLANVWRDNVTSSPEEKLSAFAKRYYTNVPAPREIAGCKVVDGVVTGELTAFFASCN